MGSKSSLLNLTGVRFPVWPVISACQKGIQKPVASRDVGSHPMPRLRAAMALSVAGAVTAAMVAACGSDDRVGDGLS